MSEHADWMARALDQARRAEQAGEVPVGALVVRDGTCLGWGHNRPIGRHDPTAHAEIQAVREAARMVGNYRLPGATLYVTLEPCVMCMGALIQARVGRLVFGCPDPRAGAAGSVYDLAHDARLNHRIEVVAGVRAQDGQALLRRFFQAKRTGSPG